MKLSESIGLLLFLVAMVVLHDGCDATIFGQRVTIAGHPSGCQ